MYLPVSTNKSHPGKFLTTYMRYLSVPCTLAASIISQEPNAFEKFYKNLI